MELIVLGLQGSRGLLLKGSTNSLEVLERGGVVGVGEGQGQEEGAVGVFRDALDQTPM